MSCATIFETGTTKQQAASEVAKEIGGRSKKKKNRKQKFEKRAWRDFEEDARARDLLETLEALCWGSRSSLEKAFSESMNFEDRNARATCFDYLRRTGWSMAEIAKFWGRQSEAVLRALKRWDVGGERNVRLSAAESERRESMRGYKRAWKERKKAGR